MPTCVAYDILLIAVFVYKYRAYSVPPGVSVHLHRQFRMEQPGNGHTGLVALELLKSCLAFIAPIPHFARLCELSEGEGDAREILDEVPVIVSET